MISKLVCFLVMLLTFTAASSQTKESDLELLRSTANAGAANTYYAHPGNNREMLEVQHSSFFAKYNPISLLLKGTMYTYQHVISPQLSRSCPYEITCSNFSKQSILEFGIVKGVFLSADRILRCNRIGVLDTDPLDFNEQYGTIMDAPDKYRR